LIQYADMNILFITIAWPDTGDRNLYTDLMDEFVMHGHEVFVLAPGYTEKISGSELKVENSIRVIRISSGKIRKASHFRKFYSLLTLNGKILKAVKKHIQNDKFDLIIAPTPPVTLSFLFRKLKKRYRAPFYLLLKDIWPQGSVDLQVLRKYNFPWMYLRSHEIRTYRTADFIGCMSPLGVSYILSKNRFLSPGKVEVCPNCIRPDNGLPDEKNRNIRLKYGIPEDACVFLFSGNLGIGHGLGFVIEAIKALSDYTKAFFVIGGSGTQFQFLQNSLAAIPRKNVFLYEWLPRKDFNQILAASDVGLIFLYRYTVPQFPSRLLSYLEYSKPVLCAITKGTDIGSVVENAGCGKSLLHGNLHDFVKAIRFFSENKTERLHMGNNARKLLMNRYTVSHGYKIIMDHFNS
jgi:glycosyltransferase involved in cell wall biosynthesis